MAEENNNPQAKSTFQRDWTKGSIVSNLLLLSWPMVVMESVYVVSQLIDMIWVGKLGSAAIAGIGIANIVLMLIMSMDMGLIVGVRAMVARYVGAGDIKGANHIAGQALIISAVWGILMMVIGFFLAELVLRLLGVDATVYREARAYMRVMFAGWVALDVWVMGLYIIQSSGDTLNPMIMEGLMRLVQIALCPFLTLGWWLFPRMGVSGTALSNLLSSVIGMVLVLLFLFSGRTRIRLTLRDFAISPGTIWRILKIGIPALTMNVQGALGNLVLTWLIAPFGTVAIAAHSIASRIQTFIYLPGMGLSMGAGVLVGQNLGAKQPRQAERSAWLAAGILEAFMVVCAGAIVLWSRQIMGVFTPEADLVALGSAFLRIAAASYLVLALSTVLQNCIAGAGDTVPNMVISIAIIWVVQMPLAYFLSKIPSLGVYGIRWAMVAAVYAGVTAYVVYFRLGRWKTRKV